MNTNQEKQEVNADNSVIKHNDETKKENKLEEKKNLKEKLDKISHKIMVLSGKGGVGKSTVAVNLAIALSQYGLKTGLLDIDIHGPSIPKMLNLYQAPLSDEQKLIYPVEYDFNLKVLSVGLFLQDKDQALIWRGPRKYGVIKQFIQDTEWGVLDYLIIDSPPGTGDEPLTIAQLIPDADGAIIVTTPQELAVEDVRKSIQFCRTVNLPVLGVIENMSGFICTDCGKVHQIFSSGGGQNMAEDMGVPFLGRIPIDPNIVESADNGNPFVSDYSHSETSIIFKDIIDNSLKINNVVKTQEL